MLPDYSRYHGSALLQIIDDCKEAISIGRLPGGQQGFYVLDGKVALYLKFSRNRRGPWAFTFARDQYDFYKAAAAQYEDCVLALVCGKDGVAAFDSKNTRLILGDDFEEQAGITIRRRLNEMYSVSGSNAHLSTKIGRDSLVEIITQLLQSRGARLSFEEPMARALANGAMP